MKSKNTSYSDEFISSVISLAWCDKTSFEMIKEQTNLSETQVINIMKKHLKSSSYKLWRERVKKRKQNNEKKFLSR